MTVVSIVIGAVLLFLLPWLGFYSFLGAHLALAFIWAAADVSIMTLAADLATQGLGATIGLVESVGMATGLLGPVLGGVIYDQNPLWLFPASGVLMLVSLLALIADVRTLRLPS